MGRVRVALDEAEEGAREITASAEDHAQRVIADAEDRAKEIVGNAETKAQRIREQSDAELQQRLSSVRELVTVLEEGFGRHLSSEIDPGPAETRAFPPQRGPRGRRK